MIKHVYNLHGYELPSRAVGIRRPPDTNYTYQYDPNGKVDLKHYACASCWFHCSNQDIEELAEHIVTVHAPKTVYSEKHPTPEGTPRTEEDELSATEIEQDIEDVEDLSAQAIDASDILGKLNEISNMFKNLLHPA